MTKIFKYIGLTLIFLFLLFPVYWMLVTSLKINTESYQAIPTLWPHTVSFEGYQTLFTDGVFFIYYKKKATGFIPITSVSYIPSKLHIRNSSSFTYHLAWSCPRPISISQLHVLPHFHL